jgi:D-alanyl-D-alanine carboxypeptidase
MHKQILFFIAGAAVCTALAAASAGAIRGSAKKKTGGSQNTPDGAQHAKTQADRVNSVLAGMSSRARAAVKIEDMNAFLSDLANVQSSDTDNSSSDSDISLLALVDKQHPLPDGYAPKHLIPLTNNDVYTVNRSGLSLRPEAESALKTLSLAARKDGVRLLASSSYRSFDYQKKVYDKWVLLDGQQEADRESARPGTSQHQLGTAVDFGSISDDFAETAMGAWMNAHAAEYGWSLSFPQGYEDVTGYRWESWHFRYIGVKACKFQAKYFSGIQQFMLEFIAGWKAENAG